HRGRAAARFDAAEVLAREDHGQTRLRGRSGTDVEPVSGANSEVRRESDARRERQATKHHFSTNATTWTVTRSGFAPSRRTTTFPVRGPAAALSSIRTRSMPSSYSAVRSFRLIWIAFTFQSTPFFPTSRVSSVTGAWTAPGVSFSGDAFTSRGAS